MLAELDSDMDPAVGACAAVEMEEELRGVLSASHSLRNPDSRPIKSLTSVCCAVTANLHEQSIFAIFFFIEVAAG